MTPEQKAFNETARVALLNPSPICLANVHVAACAWLQAEPSALETITGACVAFKDAYDVAAANIGKPYHEVLRARMGV